MGWEPQRKAKSEQTHRDQLRSSVVNWRLCAGFFALVAIIGALYTHTYVLAAVLAGHYAMAAWVSARRLGSFFGDFWYDDDLE